MALLAKRATPNDGPMHFSKSLIDFFGCMQASFAQNGISTVLVAKWPTGNSRKNPIR